MIGSYQNNQQSPIMAPYFINTAMPYILQQNAMYQQMPQNPSNIIFSIPFNGGMQYYTPQQQQQLAQLFFNSQQLQLQSNLFLNGQVQNLIGGTSPLQNSLFGNAFLSQSDNSSLPLQYTDFAQNLIKQDNIQILQQDNNQCNQEISFQALLKNDSQITNQLQHETIILTQPPASIISEPDQTNVSQHTTNNSNQADRAHIFKEIPADIQHPGSPLTKQDQVKGTNSTITNEMTSPKIQCTNPIKSASLLEHHHLADDVSSQSMNENNNTATELKITSNNNSSKFILFKERKSISQENLSSTQRTSDQDQKTLQDDNKINQESQEDNEEILLDSEELSQPVKLTKEKSIDNKSRNFSKNLLKSFFKYTQKANSDNKRFLFNFKRYISSNKTNNELIIKLLTNSPYHSYFVEFLGQPATDWIVTSKVQNVDEQMKFLELCRSGSISALKKRNHNKKKSLFSLRKQ